MNPMPDTTTREEPNGEPNRAVMRPTLRVLICGSVDSGKSTLIGRLLCEQKLAFSEQPTTFEPDSKRHGTHGGDINFALLLDGLDAEQERGTTAEVAYRYFLTPNRSFIVCDPPGHGQLTLGMVMAACNAELAIILVDVRNGLAPQAFRHLTILSLLGIQNVVLAINKIDLVDFDEEIFRDISSGFQRFAEKLHFRTMVTIPISARFDDNLSSRSERTSWYRGPYLLAYLESVDIQEAATGKPFRMAVQWVKRQNPNLRDVSGTIASGRLCCGDEIVVAESGRISRVERIVTPDGDRSTALAGDPVTLVLADNVGVACGDTLAHTTNRPQVLDQFAAHIVWIGNDEMLPGRSYLMKIGTRTVPASITELKHRIDVNTSTKLAAKTLHKNEVAFCNIGTAAPVAFDSYGDNRATGAFILIDRSTNTTAAVGLIAFGLRRATNVHYQHITVTKEVRAQVKHQRSAVLWFTGLSGAGKSTIGNLVESRLHALGAHTIMLDGDNVRHGLNKDLGFTEADRVENIRRIGEVAKLMTEAGLIVLCSFISPFRAERRLVREMLTDGEFIEIFVDAPLDVCIARDAKGLYKRALAGEIKNFTGVDQVYERPECPDIYLEAAGCSPSILADRVLEVLSQRQIFRASPK
jgi:bifunctional enzyme CysN/CysC